ncbi:MAG: hypothetical protein PHW73_01185 [Atribacterota bacterium]|nr:hypothetical protein [Atribacterota bacterium]
MTTETVIEQGKRIKAAFPSLPKFFYDILWDRLKAHNFNDDRLISAVDYLIDNCIYPVPTIANLITFDKRVKLYTYQELSKMVNEYGAIVFENYKAIKTASKMRLYACITDIEVYHLEILY